MSAPQRATVDLGAETLSSVLESFRQRAMEEEQGGAAATWPTKLKHSVFDEQVVLAWPSSEGEASTVQPPGGPVGSPSVMPVAAVGMPPSAPPVLPQLAAEDFDLADVLRTMEPFLQRLLDEVPLALGNLGRIDPAALCAEGMEPRSVTAMRRRCWVHPVQEAGNDECMLCLEPMQQGQYAWTLPCLHRGHESCCVGYFAQHGVRQVCPLCGWHARRVADDASAAAAVPPKTGTP